MSGPGSDETSPWASGSPSAPVPVAPRVVWDAAPPAGASDGTGGSGDDNRNRRNVFVVGGIVAVVLLAVLVWRTVADESTATPEPVPTTGTETAPTDPTPDTTGPPTSGENLPASSGENVTGYVDVTDVRIELPPAVARITQPTELVMQTADGLVQTLSLPSGRLRSVAVPDGPATGSTESSPGSIAITTSPNFAVSTGWGRDVVVIPRVGNPVVIAPDAFGPTSDPSSDVNGFVQVTPLGWIDRADGSPVVLAFVYDPATEGRREATIDQDGVVAPVPDARIRTFSTELGAFGPRIVNDAGGVFEIAPDGTSTRLSAGVGLALSERSILLRECDDVRQCGSVVQDLTNGDRRAVELPSELDDRSYGLELSPDGGSVAFSRYGLEPEHVIVDLASGQSVSAPDVGGQSTGAWAPDGSGQFLIRSNGQTNDQFDGQDDAESDGVDFLDAASGDVVTFAEELGSVIGIAARSPDSELDVTTPMVQTAVTMDPAPQSATGLHLAAFSGTGELSLIDVDAGVRTSWTTRPLPGPDVAQLFASGSEIAGYTTSGDGQGFVSEYGSVVGEVDAGPFADGPLLPGPDPNSLWAKGSGAAGTDRSAVDFRGRPAGIVVLRLGNGTVLGGDGRGGLVVESGGDVYVTSADGGSTRLTSGEVLAIGENHALVRECDENLQCTVFLVDRTTGERTASTLDALTAATAIGPDRTATIIGSMSPDGTVALIDFATAVDAEGGGEKWFFFDLASGNPSGAEAPDPGQPIVWSEDGAHGAYVSDGTVRIYERDTFATIEIGGLGSVRAITPVPADFGAGA